MSAPFPGLPAELKVLILLWLEAGQLWLGPVRQERGLAQAGEETEAPVETGPASAVNLPGERGGGRDQSPH